MNTLPFYQWIAGTWISAIMRNSQWGFACVETVHLLALAVLGGAVILTDMRVLGAGLRSQTPASVAAALRPLLLGSVSAMVITGGLLVASDPLKYYASPAFQWKMILFLIAVLFYATLYPRKVLFNEHRTTAGKRIAATISLSLWLGIGLAGRAIGLI